MLSRVYYALRLCWQYRKQLHNYAINPALQLPTIVSLTPAQLAAANVKGLILDFDGVLAAHAEPEPCAPAITWLKNLGNFPIYILSNKPLPERVAFFRQQFPQINFIVAARKKPYPEGVKEIISLSKLPPDQLLLIDDRLGTGIVLAVSQGLQARLIMQPYTNFAKRPLREGGFMLLRALERVWLALL